jgi:transposase
MIGWDGFHLLYRIDSVGAPASLRTIPIVETLHKLWLQNYDQENETIHRCKAGNLPPANQMIISPSDEEAHFSTKREMSWYGYRIHLIETCKQDTINLITHVETTPANEQDNLVLYEIHAAL